MQPDGWQPQGRRPWGWLFRMEQKTIAKQTRSAAARRGLTLPPEQKGTTEAGEPAPTQVATKTIA
jgi:hypothetical protein